MVMVVIDRPLAGNFVKYKQPFGWRRLHGISASFHICVLLALWPDVRQKAFRTGSRPRRSMGFRLWFADVAAGFRISGTGPLKADRRASRVVRLFVRPSRNTGEARPGARPR